MMAAQDSPRNWYCDCGAPGHLRHYPGPVPITAVWCDICYEVEKHRGPNREVGAWYLNALTMEARSLDADVPHYHEKLQELLISLKEVRSALVIEFPGEIGIDFFVQASGTLLMQYANQKADFFAQGEVDLRVASLALKTVVSGGALQDEMENSGVELEYFIDRAE